MTSSTLEPLGAVTLFTVGLNSEVRSSLSQMHY